MSDWREDFEANPCGVDPNDYSSQDDFMDSLRNNERKLNGGNNAPQKNEGCYIATCVYGSYDCSQVLTLRSFRDEKLLRSAPGRAFVRFYYATSPKLVSAFGNNRLFQSFFRGLLDRFVERVDQSN